MIRHRPECIGKRPRTLYVRGPKSEGQKWEAIGAICPTCNTYEIKVPQSGTATRPNRDRRNEKSGRKSGRMTLPGEFLRELREKEQSSR